MNSSSDHLTHDVIESLRPFVEKEIAGAVILLAQNGRILELDAVGYADLKTKRPMREDDIFWIASMTKPVVASAILVLSDEGKLSVDDPIEKHLPEFKDMWIVQEKSDDRIVLGRNQHPPTLRHLLAHTDGLTDIPLPQPETSLAEWTAAVARMPLQFQPGSKWVYNNAGLNTLGRIVEVVSGEPLPQFLKKRFFDPLGMKDTTFVLNKEQMKRLTTSYKVENGKFKRIGIMVIHGRPTAKRLTICPGGGLFSTTMDIFQFYQMLADGGMRDGRRYLSETAFKNLTTIQTGDMETGFTPGMSFGLGVGMVRKPVGITAKLSPGTFGHGGVYGTQAWIDPGNKSLLLMMLQRAGFGHEPAPGQPHYDFNMAAAERLGKTA